VRVLDLMHDPPCPVDVPIDPRLGLSGNAQMYFNRYKKAVRGRVAIERQLERGRMEAAYLDDLVLAMEQATTVADLAEVGDLLKGEGHGAVEKRRASRAGSASRRTPIHHYRIDGYDVLLGRNPRQNEEISLRLANPHDVWLHAREVPGSHVLVRNPDQGVIPETVLLRAAALAALHSKAGTSTKVTVVYTQAKHLRRPAQAPPGMVTFRHEKSLVVRIDKATAGAVAEVLRG
jgi:predicted ribosome quality control (RQC) complex YloA/Tae2 family protein